MMQLNQLLQSAQVQGVGIHFGQPCQVTIKPGEDGIRFIRTDVEGAPSIKASAQYVIETERRTTLSDGIIEINTPEHLLSALSAHGLWHVDIELDAMELPILDGSAKPWVDAIRQAGIQAHGEIEPIRLPHTIKVSDDQGAWAMAVPSDRQAFKTKLTHEPEVYGPATAQWFSDPDTYEARVGQARTFTSASNLLPMLHRGLLQGAQKEAGVVIVDQILEDSDWDVLNDAFQSEDDHPKALGPHPKTPLRLPNEPAAHKILDLVGDMALMGRPILAEIITFKPGHSINTKLALKIMETAEAFANIPVHNPNEKPLMDVVQIQKVLPHRPPFLLVDKIIEQSESHIVGVKAVTMNEPFFVGHFPSAPVMPGVLQLEAMAQVGGILALASVPDPENYLTYFLKMDNVKFKNKVSPGDTLVFSLHLEGPIRRGIVVMKGKAYVGNKLACEGVFTALITKDK